MRKVLIFAFSLLLFPFPSFSQLRQGEINVGVGAAYAIVQTKDGGYAMAGSNGEFKVLKLDKNGNLKWMQIIGSGNYNEAYSLVQTKDEGYAIAGYTEVYGAGGMDVYVVKLDSSGNLLWTRTIGGVDDDWGNSIVQTNDGGYAITGGTHSYGGGNDIYVIKLDSSGNKLWTKTIEGPWGSDDEGNSIVQTKDGGCAITGSTLDLSGWPDVFAFKLDSIGNLIWSKVIGGANSNGKGNSIVQTNDGGFAIAGFTFSYGQGNGDVYIVKLDSSGNLKWTKTIGGSNDDEAESIIQTNDGGYAVAGGTNSYGVGGANIYVIKLNSVGSLDWANTFGGIGGDVGTAIVQTKDGGYAVAGWDSCFIMLKIDSNGNSCTKTGSGGIVDSGGFITNGGTITSSNNGVMGSGGVISSGGVLTIICEVTSVEDLNPEIQTIDVYPNPNHGTFTLSLSNLPEKSNVEIYNVLGEKVYSQPTTLNSPFTIDLGTQPNGIYFYRVFQDNANLIGEGKVIIQR